MTFDTYELRWFFDAPPDFFRTSTGEAEERTDYYAPLISELSSVKWRQNHLEVKRRLGTTTVDGWAVESWSKTSIALAKVDRRLTDSPPNDWLAVTKRRQIDNIVPAKSSLPAKQAANLPAVQVEWTELVARSIRCWSFAMEAPLELEPQSVVDSLELVLGENAIDELPRCNTSYPKWLSKVLLSG